MPGVALDHLVVAARTLGDGVDWCEATLGITPGPGGRHVLMSTHNRLFAIGSPLFPRAYFEIIAVDPDAPAPGRTRWFDLDAASMHATLARGPRLIHWVARCDAIAECCRRWARLGVDRGALVAASRETPRGLLSWRISVRDDGARLFDGALPTLIEWGDRHPTDTMAESGVVLESLALAGLPPALGATLSVSGVSFGATGPALVASLMTPRGRVDLTSAPA